MPMAIKRDRNLSVAKANAKQALLSKIPRSRWPREIQYRVTGPHGNGDYVVIATAAARPDPAALKPRKPRGKRRNK
jgi:hypothetical protein